LQFLSATNGANTIHFGDGSSADAYRGYINYNHTGDRMEFATSGTERMRIDSSGAVGIGQVPETARFSGHDILQVGGRATFLGNDTVTSTGQTALLDNLYYDASGNFQHRGDARGVAMQFVEGKVIFSNSNQTTGTPTVTTRMTLDNDGNVGIGLTAPTTKLHIGDNDHLGFGTGSATKPDFRISFVTATNSLGIKCGTGGDAVDVTLSVTGDLTIAGALSKGSGSFKIDHPLESKKDTHHLVHSFVEAPQADNIYRGKVDLVDGSATVNIDTVAGMTEGTFIALNTNVQCFTSNESDWDAVKGSVSENILTISCQNTSSTATVSWLVIGERQDQHMLDTYWTDENGKVIVEPTK
jgi:hypothetical protein